MTKPTVEIACTFGFDAAHRFDAFPEAHANRRLHGHSFQVEVAVRGAPDPHSGFAIEFSELESACGAVRAALDHQVLNEIAGLEQPSLERLSIWIWGKLAARVALLASVKVRRDSLGQSCTYRGPGGAT